MSHAHRSGSALNRHPSFSIVIPTYQRRDLVCDAVRAIAATDYAGPVEIVVVVDGSTDGTAGALRQLHGVVPLKIIEQANGGAAQARNCGALQAQYDIILFLDDDMLCEPNLLEEHARMYRLGADAVIGDTPIDPRAPAGFLPESVGRWINAERVRTPLSPFDVFSGQLSIKREVFEQLGGFDTMFTDGGTFSNEDADLGVRLLQQYEVRHNPMAISRQHYIVSVREYMRRAAATAAGDHHFISKHPNLTRELFDMRGRGAILSRCLYLPLSRVPVLPQMLVAVAVWLAEWAARTRFRSNRGIARFFSGARSVAYWSEMRARSAIPDPGNLLVLCYHAIADQSADPLLAPYGITPERFAEQLRSLLNRGYSFISTDALAAYLTNEQPLPRRAVLLTFDDCYADLAEVARNVLQPSGIPALAFAVTGTAEQTNEWDQPYGARPTKLLSLDELRSIGALGVAIGSHSRTHRELPALREEKRDEEIAGSIVDLEAAGVPRPLFFAYPYGARDRATIDAVKRAGFLAAFRTGGGRITRDSPLFDLPRVLVLATDRPWHFWFKTAAPRWFERIAWVQRGLAAAPRKIWKRVHGRG